MRNMNATELLSALSWRYATKKFDPSRKIDEETWEVIRKALVLSPSSLGLQLWHFLDVRDPEVRKRLRAVSWDQSSITDASHLLVFTVKREFTAEDVERHLANLCEIRGIPRASMDAYAERIGGLTKIKSPAEMTAWLERQVYIALGVAITSAAVLGIDSCPVEAIEPEEYDRILGLDKGEYRTLCALPMGYRGEDPYSEQAKVRFSEESLIEIV